MDENYGRLEIRLNELLKERGLSKNKLSHKAEMNWKQIDNYCTNNISRLDVFVLCKLCTVLVPIGKPLMLSPAFPPASTGHATFTASGAPSSIVSAVIHTHSFTLAKSVCYDLH